MRADIFHRELFALILHVMLFNLLSDSVFAHILQPAKREPFEYGAMDICATVRFPYDGLPTV